MKKLTIGRLAKKTGVSPVTLRFYEQCGLIPKASRSPAGYRLYPEDIIEHIQFLKNAKNAGFSLAEISELVSLLGDEKTSLEEIKKQLLEKANAIEEKINSLKNVQKTLKQYASTPEKIRFTKGMTPPTRAVTFMLEEAAEA